MKKSVFFLAAILLIALTTTCFAQKPVTRLPSKNSPYWSCPPPRFQLFEAPRPYGGILMVDTETGKTFQRIIVNTPKGIDIRWLEIKVKPVVEGESVQWN